jgi:hypothetical protein
MPRIQKMKILLLFFTFFSGAVGASWWYTPPTIAAWAPQQLGEPYEKLVYLPWLSCEIDSAVEMTDEEYAYYADNCFVDDGKWLKFKMPAN